MKETFINSTAAYCKDCGKYEPARIVSRDNIVYLERLCAKDKIHSVIIASDFSWYEERINHTTPIIQLKDALPIVKGCPYDCGPCSFHTAELRLPVFSITNDCNLNCPICFTYNRQDKKYYKSIEDIKKIIENILKRCENIEIINITGGEPTLHPDFFEILALFRSYGIPRITVNTNGVRIAEDLEFALKIKESGVQMVLSLHTLEPEKSELIYGADISALKIKALETLEKSDIPVTLLPVAIKGLNEPDVGKIINAYFFKDFVKSITVQNMTFTGKNGSLFKPRKHIAIDEVEKIIEKYSDGKIKQSDFFPLGAYHQLCYSAGYFIVNKNKIISLSKILPKKIFKEYTVKSYVLNPEREFEQHFREGLNNFWANNDTNENAVDDIRILKSFLKSLFPDNENITDTERKKRAESMIKMILIHPHMDEDNFDIDRVTRCADMVPDESGALIPACSYNLIHRAKDPRFWIGE